VVLILFGFGAYKKESSVLNMEEIKNVIRGITAAFLLFTIIIVFVKLAPSRYVLLFSYIISLIFILSERTALYHLLISTFPLKYLNEKVLIYGAGELGQALYRSFVNSPKLGIVPVGFIDDNQDILGKKFYPSGYNNSNYISVLGHGQDILHLKKELNIMKVYVAIANIKYSTLIDILNCLKAEKIETAFVPNLYKVFMHRMKVSKIGKIPIVEFEGANSSFYLSIKRYFDFLFASILLFLVLPLFLVIALSIKIDSKGSVFFKHDRVGKNGKLFSIYKFRSMFMDSDPYTVNPLDKADSRITRVGRFLRKTSLDELPQLINVLKGEMSIVGPRPEMPFIVDKYNEIHRERLKVLPGITGLWQLSGDRKKAIHENMDYDLYYIRNVSFFLDLAILIETLVFAFKGI